MFTDLARDRTRRLRLTQDEKRWLEARGFVICEECVFEGYGSRSVWRPKDPDEYFERGDGVVLCPAHLRESGYMNEPTTSDLWLYGFAGADERWLAEFYEVRPNTVAKSPSVRAGRHLGKYVQHQRVIDFHEAGLSTKEISEQTRIPLRSVQRIVREGRDGAPGLTEDDIERGSEHVQGFVDAMFGRELERLTAENERLRGEIAKRNLKLRELGLAEIHPFRRNGKQH